MLAARGTSLVVVVLGLVELATAPIRLLISTDLNKLSAAALLETLGSVDAITVNQDVLGVQGRRVSNSSLGAQVWAAGPLSGKEVAVVLLNTATSAQDIEVSRETLVAVAELVGGGVTVAARLQAHDLWAARAVVGEVSGHTSVTLPVAAHGCRFLRLVAPKLDGLPSLKTDDAVPVFESGIGGFPCVRVPSLLAVPAGPLLAFAECRSFTGDGCEPASGPVVVDERERVVCMRTSTSGGKTSRRGETVILLHPPLHLVGVSIGINVSK